jgi:hypothetical protein
MATRENTIPIAPQAQLSTSRVGRHILPAFLLGFDLLPLGVKVVE